MIAVLGVMTVLAVAFGAVAFGIVHHDRRERRRFADSVRRAERERMAGGGY